MVQGYLTVEDGSGDRSTMTINFATGTPAATAITALANLAQTVDTYIEGAFVGVGVNIKGEGEDLGSQVPGANSDVEKKAAFSISTAAGKTARISFPAAGAGAFNLNSDDVVAGFRTDVQTWITNNPAVDSNGSDLLVVRKAVKAFSRAR